MYAQWLKEQFELYPRKSKAGLARALNLEPPAISKILNGTRQIKAQEYNLMRKYFGLPVDGNHPSASPDNAYRLETLAGEQPALNDSADNQDSSWSIPMGILAQHTKAPPEKIKIFNVLENFMEPDYKRGEHVVVDLSDSTPSPSGAFIISDGFGIMLRFCEFVPNSNPPQVKISAPNRKFQAQILRLKDFEILGRVIAKLQWT